MFSSRDDTSLGDVHELIFKQAASDVDNTGDTGQIKSPGSTFTFKLKEETCS